ncbi:RagB/SusD family nutrient uptake outer membrane protein [Pedobacter sp. GR22-6]|uniref:RagB/SusD family nutrient uptake outer membrane protein n=1 Tax=Pedobacter sp. GR22-6 TaxID=3127957 RepID=UPI00307ED03B
MKKLLYYTCLLLLLAPLSSCNKFLDLSPQDGITKQEFWRTKEDVKAAVFGCYSSLLAPPPNVRDKALTEYIFLWGELRADMIGKTTYSTEEEKSIMDMNILSTNSISSWASFYRTINYCNTVLDFSPDAKKLDPTFSNTEYNQYIGEALTIRSLMYFYLVRTFGDVPLKLISTARDTDIKEIGKTGQQEILNQLVADLKKAQGYLPLTYGNDRADKGRVSRFAADALLADVYLWMEKYPECIQECDKVLADTRFGYISGNSAWYNSVFFLGSSKETIFEFSNATSVNNIFYDLLVNTRKRFTASNFVGTEIFIPSDDADSVDTRGEGTFYLSNLTISKYGTENPSYVNFQVYRYSDIKLMKAEALALTSRGAEALEIVNELRNIRNAVGASKENPDAGDADAICDYILAERGREFAFEGKRWFDILRNAKRGGYTAHGRALIEGFVGKTVSVALQQSAINKLKDANSHYLPISETELFADTKLVQNPFYTK